ncbi:alpha/beta hydrolase [Liquorilactobacillus mali]|uniref:alpha/beta hydrolase n=1 Tax=Liquorilactobacillus mali TaxID=1618 RepID=UPI000704CCAE|nr:alpha/beta hydrolase [Liquorilactobacillus mali]MDN7144914.1 alpha/beta hydrolase [Liquorilactobacillus mali]
MSIIELTIPLPNENLVTATAYVLPITTPKNKAFPGIVLCAGGSFKHLSQRENTLAALAFHSRGFNVYSLNYSLLSSETGSLYPAPLHEIASTVAFVRNNAKKLNQDPNAIITLGFSAGGHIVSALAGTWATVKLASELDLSNESIKPNAQILAYPLTDLTSFFTHKSTEINRITTIPELMNTQKLVNTKTPPTFIWNSYTDTAVPLSNTLGYIKQLAKNKIPFESHIFSSGIHGTVLANSLTARPEKGPADINAHVATWVNLAIEWAFSQFRNS